MSKKFKGMDYSQLTDNTKQAYKSKLNQLHKANLTISEAIQMNNTDLANKLGLNPRSKSRTKEQVAETYKRVYKQIRATKDRRENTIDLAHKSHRKLGYTQKQMNDLKLELTKTAGNSFIYISDVLATKDKNLRQTRTKNDDSWTEANKHTKELLLLPKSEREKLSQVEQDLLKEFSP